MVVVPGDLWVVFNEKPQQHAWSAAIDAALCASTVYCSTNEKYDTLTNNFNVTTVRAAMKVLELFDCVDLFHVDVCRSQLGQLAYWSTPPQMPLFRLYPPILALVRQNGIQFQQRKTKPESELQTNGLGATFQ